MWNGSGTSAVRRMIAGTPSGRFPFEFSGLRVVLVPAVDVPRELVATYSRCLPPIPEGEVYRRPRSGRGRGLLNGYVNIVEGFGQNAGLGTDAAVLPGAAARV